MRKLFFTAILLFVLGIGQIWAETRTFDGSTKFYVMNYKPSGLGGSTLWAISDDCKFYFDLVDGSAGHHWYEATLVSGSGAYSEGAIYSITPDAGTYSYFIMTRGKGKSFGDATNQTGNIGFHSDASYNLVNGGYDKDGTGTTWGKLTPKSVTSDGTGVLYFNLSPSSATWWTCGTNGDQNFVYFFNNSGEGKWSSSSVQVSGNINKVSVPEGTWDGVILSRQKSTSDPGFDGSKQYNQTQDIPLVDGKNYLSNFGEAPGTYTWEDFIPTGTTVLNGTMNDWSLITAKAFTDGELAITLPARKTMSFKIVEGNNGSGTWYGLTDANCILSDMTDWGFSSSGTNTRINTAGEGTYTFAYNASHQLSVTYPEVTHPNADYVYLIKYGWSSWRIHFDQASTTYGIAKTTWTGQELTVASGTITNTYDYTAPGEEDAQTYFYYAVGDYPKFNFNDNSSSNQTNDQTPSPGQYMYNDGDSWEWGSFVYSVTLNTNSGTIEDGHDVTSYTFGTGATLPNSDYISRTGYTFGGWYNNAEFDGSAITAISTTDNGDTTLYAKWTAKDYNISYDMNGGVWGSGWVGTRTYDAGDQAISGDVTKTDYNFAGWYDNGSFVGDAITAVSSTLADDITLYAKWTAFSKTTLTPALNPIICTASEGDVVVVTVSATQSASAYIQLEDKDGVAFGDNLPISGAGTYAIPLTSADAAKVNAGLNVSGSNYTISAVTIKYQKTLWDDGIDGTSAWASDELSQSIFSDLSAGDFLGVTVTNTNGGGYYSYRIQINYVDLYEQAVSGTGTFIRQLTSGEITSLTTTDKTITIASGNSALSALYTYVATKDYTVTLNTNDGTINDGNVTSYTFGVGATLPTNVTRWGYKFDGWYDNSSFTGSAVTTITTSDYGNKEYWAKWTSIEETMLSGSHPEFLAAEEGDILVITVTNTQPRAQIYLQSTDYELCIGSKWIAGTGAGKHVIQLTADGATALHTGVIITGENYTKSSVALLYKKTIWSEGVADVSGWTNKTISDRTGFAGIADGDYLGFTVTNLYDKDNKDNQYFMQYKNEEFITSAGIDETGTYFEVVPSEGADKLKTGKEDLTIAAKYLTLSELNRYLTTRDYTVTLNTNGGTINAGNISSYTYQTGATLPTDVTRTNYTFCGWFDNAELTGSAVTSITTSDLGNKTYYAKWKFVIYRTGDAPDGGIETFEGGTIDSPIEYRMKVREIDKWYTLCLPFDVDSVCVWDAEDGKYYKMKPYYRSAPGETFYTGHYVIRTPYGENVTGPGIEIELENFDDWRDPVNASVLPSASTPYIIQWHHDYFQDRYISFFGATGQTIPNSMTSVDAPTENDKVRVCGNDAMKEGEVSGAYLLDNDYGSGAWLRDENVETVRTINPFECYIIASDETTGRYLAIRRGMTTDDTPTGWDDVLNSERKQIITVYTLSGFQVTQYNDCSFNQAAQRLHNEQNEGIFILRSENESIKLMVGGK